MPCGRFIPSSLDLWEVPLSFLKNGKVLKVAGEFPCGDMLRGKSTSVRDCKYEAWKAAWARRRKKGSRREEQSSRITAKEFGIQFKCEKTCERNIKGKGWEEEMIVMWTNNKEESSARMKRSGEKPRLEHEGSSAKYWTWERRLGREGKKKKEEKLRALILMWSGSLGRKTTGIFIVHLLSEPLFALFSEVFIWPFLWEAKHIYWQTNFDAVHYVKRTERRRNQWWLLPPRFYPRMHILFCQKGYELV